MHCFASTHPIGFVAAVFGFGLAPMIVAAQQPDVFDAGTGRAHLNAAIGNAGIRDHGTQLMIIDIMDVELAGAASGGPYVATAFLRGLGESTGPAIQLQIEATSGFRFSDRGVVVEPLLIRDAARGDLESRITSLAAGSPVTRILNAYCLEFDAEPPAFDQIFRIAEPRIQENYRPAADILAASRDLIATSDLGDRPLAYIHSIKQWSLWAQEGDMDQEEFEDRFLQHARDNYGSADVPWTEESEREARASVPQRWAYIDRILAGAGLANGDAERPE